MRALLIAALVAAVALPAEAGSWTKREPYVAAVGDVVVDCGNNLGGACFSVPAGATSVRIEADDASGRATEVYWAVDSGTVTYGGGTFCGSAEVRLPAVSGLVLYVYISETGGLFDCSGPGTWGVLTADFTVPTSNSTRSTQSIPGLQEDLWTLHQAGDELPPIPEPIDGPLIPLEDEGGVPGAVETVAETPGRIVEDLAEYVEETLAPLPGI